ncbi:MAG TPA: serine hydrolase domain-containing protein [Chitinophagaceae bacterium]|nr:serine hydrolase domain-containing protein [Chitinophagaceae bacterium]
MKKIFYFLFLAILFQDCNTSGQKKDADDSLRYYPPTPAVLSKQEFRQHYRELSAFFDSSLLKNGFNGSILVARDGAILYEKYQGLADLRKKDLPAGEAGPLTDSTSLHIASTSKPFTATAILRLVQEEKLSLNDSVAKFFPDFPYPGITIKMLLNHRSGLPNYLYFMSDGDWDKKKYALNQDVLDYLIVKKPNKSFSPDKRFNYCNTNYVLLALIIEKISGNSFPDYMQQKFFGPIGMNHTYVFTLKDTLTATPSFTNNGTYWNFDFLDGTYGDKNIYTTPRDLLKWDQALYTDQLISKALLDSAFSGYSNERPSVHNYGLGWRLQFMPNGKKVVYHFGKWHGSNAAFARLTDEKATIIILGNKFTRNIYNAAHFCYDIFGNYHQRPANEDEDIDSVSNDKKAELPGLKKKKTKKSVKTVSKTKH